MYEIIKSVINSRDFELSDMLKKINTMWVKGKITEIQMNELIELARKNADPNMSVDISGRIDDLEARVRKLEEAGSVQPDPGPGGDPEYPNFQPNHVYVKGDKVTFNGKKYVCILNEYTDKTTWSPGDYPDYWQEVKQV